MAASVTAVLTLKNGTKQEFSFPAGSLEKTVDLKILQESLRNLQKDTNEALTVLVNQEKATNNCSRNGKQDQDDDEEDEEEDEEEDNSSKNKKNTDTIKSEPPIKKSKR
ncbi:mRNA 3'-end-processing protein RNA14 [Lingula anatina]|uniref:mRNA 3'-end-processing protein RNA14 n=1 Tax=Lingula anatina TaxID=7574 RepID=A0A1S3J5P9_LINAN|nr:mRNA 3'-end-processing protein RNA14 [Lingula anatina]|eukprot:XP_013405720.1 mRNA 3'-end-processing protein RNA14 [Lingula anatina]